MRIFILVYSNYEYSENVFVHSDKELLVKFAEKNYPDFIPVDINSWNGPSRRVYLNIEEWQDGVKCNY